MPPRLPRGAVRRPGNAPRPRGAPARAPRAAPALDRRGPDALRLGVTDRAGGRATI